MPVKKAQLVKCRKLSAGLFYPSVTSVIMEKELPVHINGEHLFSASIVPDMEKEFVAGYLFGQGFIQSVAEIKSVDIKSDGAHVILENTGKLSSAATPPSFRIVSGGGKTAYLDTLAFPVIKSNVKYKKTDIFKAMNTLFEKAELYRETEGAHAAGIFSADARPLCIVEDIGRHNTIDKAIGYVLLNGIDCHNVFLVSTGRMASEMVAKICRAGIPLVATKTAVTDKGLETGVKGGLTIIGFVRDAGTKINTDMDVRVIDKPQMKIYCGPERVTY
jgi:FdhD protein